MIEPRYALAAVWIWHSVFTLLLTIAVGRSAARVCGSPVAYACLLFRIPFRSRRYCLPIARGLYWPVAGRWLLAAFLGTVSAMLLQIAWTVFRNRVLDNVGRDLDWSDVWFYFLPIPLGPWVFWRQWKRGLTNDEF